MIKRSSKNKIEQLLEQNNWSVLDIGCGYSANKFANVICDTQNLEHYYKEKKFVQLKDKKLPFKDNAIEACFSHMLYCMALSNSELKNLNDEVCRILKPGGINIFTVRHTGDGDYKNGIHIGQDLYKNDGFIVHFLSEEKVTKISNGFNIVNIERFEEGAFPRKLFRVILKKK